MSEIETNIYDIEEIHKNCTVQILRNSVTGEQSIGWNEDKEPESMLDALDSVTWYNGLAEAVFSWYFLDENDWHNISAPDNYGLDSKPMTADDYGYHQLQVLWMIAVEMFGDCGTSPRFGWIEKDKIAEFREWVLRITELWRSSDDYNGPEEYRKVYEF